MEEITISFYTNSCSLYNDLQTLYVFRVLFPLNGFKSDAFVYECESTFKGTLGLKMLLLSIKYVLVF